MKNICITPNELTGARVTIPFTAFKHFGPKHHAIVLGINDEDGEIWIAELSRRFGYRLVVLKQWIEDNRDHIDGLIIKANTGPRTNIDVAQSAIREVQAHAENETGYHVLFNNCETFVDRQFNGKTTLSPQVRKSARVLGFVIAGGMLILRRSLTRRFFF